MSGIIKHSDPSPLTVDLNDDEEVGSIEVRSKRPINVLRLNI